MCARIVMQERTDLPFELTAFVRFDLARAVYALAGATDKPSHMFGHGARFSDVGFCERFATDADTGADKRATLRIKVNSAVDAI